MTVGSVAVAPELERLAGPSPEWPDGQRTIFAAPDDERLPGARVEAIIPLVTHRVGIDEIARLSDLRVIGNYGVGYDNVDVPAAAERGIVVTNTPGVLTDATADLTMALILAAARRLREGLEVASSGEWPGWSPMELLGMGLRGKTLGIIGAGRIGTAVARRAVAFGLTILYWSRSESPELADELGASRCVTLEELLRKSDVVSVHVALSPETTGLLGPEELRLMKPDSVLVNTARGPIVDEVALAAALRDGVIGAAGLDVFNREPEIHPGLLVLPNAFVLPHLGSATREARQGMWDIASANVRAVLAGGAPLSPVSA